MPNERVNRIAQVLWRAVHGDPSTEDPTLRFETVLALLDPEGLVRMGAPLDEYSVEAGRIAARLPSCKTEDDLAAVVEDVFHDAFTVNGKTSAYRGRDD